MPSRSLFTSKTPEWYTPPAVLADVRRLFGGDYFDPCPAPEPGVPRIDGLRIPWTGRVFVNPPYGRAIGLWTAKAVRDPLDEAILLVPARTDTQWFQPLLALNICFVSGRLHFSGHPDSAPFPSALVYRGPDHAAFVRVFSHWGPIMQPYNVLTARRQW